MQGNRYNDAGAEAIDNVDGPVGYEFDSTVNTARQGVYQVTYSAVDSVGNMNQATRTVRVTDVSGNIDIQAPAITLAGESQVFAAVGRAYADRGATATDNIDGNLTGQIVIDNPVDSDILGQYIVRYSVTDRAGNKGYAERQVDVVNAEDIPDNDAPLVSFDNLADSQTLSAPVDIQITVDDQRLSGWQLSLRGTSDTDFNPLASGETTVFSSAVAQFDPTLLINGQYQLLLEATDEAGRKSREQIALEVEGNMKVGNFTISFEDLSIPMAGLPITVNRSYDSRQRSESQDFGYGWSIDYQDVEIDESRTPGDGWALNQYSRGPGGLIPDFCVELVGEAKVSITLPDGEVETFIPRAEPECNPLPLLDVSIAFSPETGTTSTLRALNNNMGRLNQSTGIIGDIASDQPADPDRYELNTQAGYIYTINQQTGIETVVDPNGNTITYSDAGITHSAGKSIVFTRDADNRITEVEDPNGNIISYGYDANGDLIGVTDRAFATTSYTYNNSHGLLEIEDPLGQTPLKNIYDDNGRLIAQVDSDGNRTEFNHDIEGRQSIVTDRLGRTTLLYYDERGNVTSEVNALNETTTRSYDAEDNQLSETNALGHTTKELQGQAS